MNLLKSIWHFFCPPSTPFSIKWNEGYSMGYANGSAVCPYSDLESRYPWVMGYSHGADAKRAVKRRGYAYDIFGRT